MVRKCLSGIVVKVQANIGNTNIGPHTLIGSRVLCRAGLAGLLLCPPEGQESFLSFISTATRYSTLAGASGLHLLLGHPCDLGLGDIPGGITTLIHSDDQSLRLI